MSTVQGTKALFVNSNITCEHCVGDKGHCSHTVHGSHDTIHTLEKKKKKKGRKKAVYTNVGLETWIQPTLKYGSGK